MIGLYASLFGLKHIGKIESISTSVGIFTSGLGPLMFNLFKENNGSYTKAIYICIFSVFFTTTLIVYNKNGAFS